MKLTQEQLAALVAAENKTHLAQKALEFLQGTFLAELGASVTAVFSLCRKCGLLQAGKPAPCPECDAPQQPPKSQA